MAQLNFDAQNVPQNEALDPIPADWYKAMIVESEMKATSAGSGVYLMLTMQVLEGPYAGRKIFDRLNLNNPNPVAVEIAYKTLSSICHSVNQIQVQDSQQLHGKPLQVKVVVKPPKDGYDASNDVKGYKAIDAGGAAVGAAAPAWANPGVPTAALAQPAPAAMTFTTAPAQAPTYAPVQTAPAYAAAPVQPVQAVAPVQPFYGPAPVQAPVEQAAPVQQAPVQAPVGPGAPVPPWQQPGQPTPVQQAAPQYAAPAVTGPAGAVPPWAQPVQ